MTSSPPLLTVCAPPQDWACSSECYTLPILSKCGCSNHNAMWQTVTNVFSSCSLSVSFRVCACVGVGGGVLEGSLHPFLDSLSLVNWNSHVSSTLYLYSFGFFTHLFSERGRERGRKRGRERENLSLTWGSNSGTKRPEPEPKSRADRAAQAPQSSFVLFCFLNPKVDLCCFLVNS